MTTYLPMGLHAQLILQNHPYLKTLVWIVTHDLSRPITYPHDVLRALPPLLPSLEDLTLLLRDPFGFYNRNQMDFSAFTAHKQLEIQEKFRFVKNFLMFPPGPHFHRDDLSDRLPRSLDIHLRVMLKPECIAWSGLGIGNEVNDLHISNVELNCAVIMEKYISWSKLPILNAKICHWDKGAILVGIRVWSNRLRRIDRDMLGFRSLIGLRWFNIKRFEGSSSFRNPCRFITKVNQKYVCVARLRARLRPLCLRRSSLHVVPPFFCRPLCRTAQRAWWFKYWEIHLPDYACSPNDFVCHCFVVRSLRLSLPRDQ